ncbi:MAG: CHAT domain-containing protein, partial [Acidobacteriaceae bacterium]|nr:CHAT domain-containing protein [Acidobacteriaceae bacterium]
AGSTHSKLGEYEKALAAYDKALPLWRAAADRSGEGATLKAKGDVYLKLGEQAKALEQLQQALEMNRLMGDRSGTIQLLNRIGAIYSAQGLPQQSLDYFEQSLSVARSSGDRAAEADALGSLGNTYRDLGAEERAMEYYRQSLSLEQSLGDRLAESNVLIAFGDATFFLGDKDSSLDYYQRALALKRSLGDQSGEALTLIGIGNVYSDLGARQKRSERPGPVEMQKALDYYEQALAIGKSIHDTSVEVFGRIGAGVAYSALGDKTKALQYINQTLFIFDIAKYKPGQGWALYEKARVERDRGDLAEALKHVTASRDIIESLRTNMLSQELRATFVAAVHDCHELEVDVLMRMHAANPSGRYQADAVTANERARARVLLETLAEAHADVRTGADPVLLDREKKLQVELNSKETARIQMLGAGQTTAALDRSIADLTAQYEEVRTQIRTRNPHYAALTYPQPMSLAEIQTEVLDPATILLEYSLGEQRSYLWAISSAGIRTFTLPRRTEIEEAAKRFREVLTASGTTASSDAGKSLSRIIFGDAGENLGDKRLLVVADGALQVLPFAALPDPAAPDQPLIVNHEIVNIPSASTLGVLRRENAGRKRAPKAVAVLADPVFSVDDSRFQSSLNARRDAGLAGVRLPRLPGTRREAAAISALLPESERKVALDFEASHATLTSAELAQYRTLHLATHGLLNSVHPELSGVVLSLVDRQGRPQDGFLRLHEIYNMKLAADLIVLSACQTGLGQEIRGEGLVGLTRGFLYAGASRVLASLWKVDDRATAELMRRFYSAMLGPQSLGPAAALRSAQIAMWRT